MSGTAPDTGDNGRAPDFSVSEEIQAAVQAIDEANTRRHRSMRGLYALLGRLGDLLDRANAEIAARDRQLQELSQRADRAEAQRRKLEHEMEAAQGSHQQMTAGLQEAAQADHREATLIEQACADIGQAVHELETEGLDQRRVRKVVDTIRRYTGEEPGPDARPDGPADTAGPAEGAPATTASNAAAPTPRSAAEPAG